MTCRELVELMIDYLAGDLPEDVCVHIREHIERCSPCDHFFQSYRITVKITRQLPQSPMPKSLSEKLNALLSQIKKQ